jgi:ethanolamine ammonia-lyase large subunit
MTYSATAHGKSFHFRDLRNLLAKAALRRAADSANGIT